jgi:hypothetical protein
MSVRSAAQSLLWRSRTTRMIGQRWLGTPLSRVGAPGTSLLSRGDCGTKTNARGAAATSASCRAIRCGGNCRSPSSDMAAAWPGCEAHPRSGVSASRLALAPHPISRAGPAIPATFRRRPALIPRRPNRRSVMHGAGCGQPRCFDSLTLATTVPAGRSAPPCR